MKISDKNSLMEISIPNKPEFLRVVRLLVSGYASRWPLSIDEVENIKVAVSEACNTAIQTSAKSDQEEYIKIKCWQENKQIVFEIKDKTSGSPAAEGVEELEERGLGMLLIRTLMDYVDVKTKPGKGSKIIMKKNIKSA
ncbi:MAG: ATP-binding protein [bacterium]